MIKEISVYNLPNTRMVPDDDKPGYAKPIPIVSDDNIEVIINKINEIVRVLNQERV